MRLLSLRRGTKKGERERERNIRKPRRWKILPRVSRVGDTYGTRRHARTREFLSLPPASSVCIAPRGKVLLSPASLPGLQYHSLIALARRSFASPASFCSYRRVTPSPSVAAAFSNATRLSNGAVTTKSLHFPTVFSFPRFCLIPILRLVPKIKRKTRNVIERSRAVGFIFGECAPSVEASRCFSRIKEVIASLVARPFNNLRDKWTRHIFWH